MEGQIALNYDAILEQLILFFSEISAHVTRLMHHRIIRKEDEEVLKITYVLDFWQTLQQYFMVGHDCRAKGSIRSYLKRHIHVVPKGLCPVYVSAMEEL